MWLPTYDEQHEVVESREQNFDRHDDCVRDRDPADLKNGRRISNRFGEEAQTDWAAEVAVRTSSYGALGTEEILLAAMKIL